MTIGELIDRCQKAGLNVSFERIPARQDVLTREVRSWFLTFEANQLIGPNMRMVWERKDEVNAGAISDFTYPLWDLIESTKQ